MATNRLSVQECRTLLGESASGHSDEQIERLRNSLECLAEQMYDEIVRQARRDPEGVRWFAYGFENPEGADCPDIPDDAFPDDGPNLLDFDDETIQ